MLIQFLLMIGLSNLIETAANKTNTADRSPGCVDIKMNCGSYRPYYCGFSSFRAKCKKTCKRCHTSAVPNRSTTTTTPRRSTTTTTPRRSTTTTTTRRTSTRRPEPQKPVQKHHNTENMNGNCKCGLLNKPVEVLRIVGGSDAIPGEFSWMAHIMLNLRSWCGGSLIGAQWVLTARHCTLLRDKLEVKANQLKVALGDHDKHRLGKNELEMSVIEIMNHPDYTTYPNVDFALLKLAQPVDFSKHTHIRPICLPENLRQQYEGETATAAGWGRQTNGGRFARILQKVDLKIMSNKLCNRQYHGNARSSRVTTFMLCADMPGTNKDACQGDSGGPLVTASGGSGMTPGENYELVGVTSWGWGCGKYPGVYGRVTEAMDWIQKTVGNNLNTCPRV